MFPNCLVHVAVQTEGLQVLWLVATAQYHWYPVVEVNTPGPQCSVEATSYTYQRPSLPYPFLSDTGSILEVCPALPLEPLLALITLYSGTSFAAENFSGLASGDLTITLQNWFSTCVAGKNL